MKTAFVLSGGGSKGAFQAGVLYQLIKHKGIIPDIIYGTSVGAINAAGISYLDIDEFKDMWLNIKGDYEVVWPTGWQKYICWPKILWTGGFYSLAPLEKWLRTLFSGRVHNCESKSCYIDLKSGNANYCSNFQVDLDSYIRSILASAAIPILIEDQNYCVDGGVRHVTPIDKAIEEGADIIYIILCRPYSNVLQSWSPPKKLPRILEVGFRAVDDVMSHEIFINDLKMALMYNEHSEYFNKKKIEIHTYAPDRMWMDTIDFDPVKIKEAFSAGTTTEELS